MLNIFTHKAQQAIEYAQNLSRQFKHGYVGTEHLLLGLVSVEDSVAQSVLVNNSVEYDKLVELIKQYMAPTSKISVKDKDGFTPRANDIIEAAYEEKDAFGEELVGTEHLLIAIMKDSDCAAVRLLNTIGVNMKKMYSDLMVGMGENPSKHKNDLGKDKSKNKKSMLEQYSRDLTALARQDKLDPVVGREEEIQRVIQILSRRNKNNPCLIGEPGVGKTAIVEGLAQRIAFDNVPELIAGKRVMTLDLAAMIAGSKYRGEFEERIKRLIDEVRTDGNILLFLDELHTVIGAGGAEGAIDASNILKPSLARGEIQLIGATTMEEYRKHIEKDAALERRFQPVKVEEPTVEETVGILKGLKTRYERHHKLTITDKAVVAAASMSKRYISDRFLPDKAIDLMDEAASRKRLNFGDNTKEITLREGIKELELEFENAVMSGDLENASSIKKKISRKTSQLNKLKAEAGALKSENVVVDEDDIAAVVSVWTKIPVQKLAKQESKKLLELESELHKRVIGQQEAIESVAKAVRRGRVGLKDPKRPIGSFLFLGPTGVGKTELSKALAETVFGSENNIIRVDMSEYMEKHTVSKLIGSPPGYVGYDEGGQLSEKVRRNPYSVILFDEIEKAHPDVFNILLQVLDDGRITDSTGRVVDFKNTVIIMTSNAGAENIVEPKLLGFSAKSDANKDHEVMKNKVLEVVKRLFKPEFINRIDEMIVFRTLNKEEIAQIVDLMIKQINVYANEQLGLTIKLDNEARAYIVDKGYDVKYGARPLRRLIQKKIEDPLAEELLKKQIKRGSIVTVSFENDNPKFSIKSSLNTRKKR